MSAVNEPTGTFQPLRWRIGSALFDPTSAKIERESNTFELDRSSLLVLRCLVEQAGEAVDKDILLRAGWPSRHVTENSLTKAIGRLRQALGDEQGEMVRVVHGFGYRLLSAIPVPDPQEFIPSGLTNHAASEVGVNTESKSWAFHVRGRAKLILGACLGVLLGLMVWHANATPGIDVTHATILPSTPKPPSIAILPLADLSPNHDQSYFSDGLSDQLIANLSILPEINVVGRTSSFPYREKGLDAVTIGRELKVGTVLDGSVRKDGDRLRVTVELVDTQTGYRLWSEIFDRPFKDLFTIQDEIARAVLASLRVELLPEKIQGMRGFHTNNPEAFERFLFGNHIWKDDETSQRRSLAAYQRAVELDPEFYEAWVSLADCLGHSGLYADRAEEALAGKRQAMKALDRAIAIAPDQAKAWLERGDLKYAHWWDWTGGAQDLERGAAAGAHDTVDYLLRMARLRAALGHLEEAVSLNRRASQVDPRHATPLVVMGYHLTALGRYEEAERLLTQAAHLNPSDDHVHYYLGLGKLFRGNPREAIAHFEDSAFAFRLTGLAIAQHQLGDRTKSDQALKTLRERYGHILPYQLAEVHAFRGERDLAFQWLERSCQLHDASLMYLLWDPLLLNLRGDPRYTAVLQKVHLPLAPIPPAPALGFHR
jgi:TolB-like protein/DNA-binding winged helix-turn-helix (wHTH) protein/tetratricopeptide (TPR) repeat protein